MSSLRNAVKRREHKERGQPLERKKLGLGLLEKHKDYVSRAKDYHSKQNRLKSMQLKAAFRNPDEFYFSMNHGKTQDGVHVSSNNYREKLSAEVLKVMKTQDVAYLHMKRNVDLKKAQKLQASHHFIDVEKSNKHKIFVNSRKDLDSFNVAEHFDTVPELAARVSNRIRKSDLKEVTVTAPDASTLKKVYKQRNAMYREMGDRVDRAQKIDRLRVHLELERHLQSKGTKIKVKDAENGKPAVYKWKRQRTK